MLRFSGTKMYHICMGGGGGGLFKKIVTNLSQRAFCGENPEDHDDGDEDNRDEGERPADANGPPRVLVHHCLTLVRQIGIADAPHHKDYLRSSKPRLCMSSLNAFPFCFGLMHGSVVDLLK